MTMTKQATTNEATIKLTKDIVNDCVAVKGADRYVCAYMANKKLF